MQRSVGPPGVAGRSRADTAGRRHRRWTRWRSGSLPTQRPRRSAAWTTSRPVSWRWSGRCAAHVYRRADLPGAAAATAPFSEADAATWVFDAPVRAWRSTGPPTRSRWRWTATGGGCWLPTSTASVPARPARPGCRAPSTRTCRPATARCWCPEARAKDLWRTLGRPGAVLVGEVAGTWRPRRAGRRLTVQVGPWREVPTAALEAEAGRLAAVRGTELAALALGG